MWFEQKAYETTPSAYSQDVMNWRVHDFTGQNKKIFVLTIYSERRVFSN